MNYLLKIKKNIIVVQITKLMSHRLPFHLKRAFRIWPENLGFPVSPVMPFTNVAITSSSSAIKITNYRLCKYS